ncbi:MAG: amylo-alpha-1,6-glucosidase [Candidatus Saccharimonadales bacterium]
MLADNWPLPKLLAGEELVGVQDLGEVEPARLPSSLREVQRLASARNRSEVGDFGPVMASLGLDSASQNNAEQHRYEALFGRDSLRVALDLVDRYPKLARTTLTTLAELQGMTTDSMREEEPGRIVHEARDPKKDPIARQLTKDRGWAWPYYGSVDATPEFIRTLAAYCSHNDRGMEFLSQSYTGRDGRQHNMAEALQAAGQWIVRRLSANAEGLLEFKRANPGGLENQAWKDSPDAYCHADGQLANHDYGIASIEVQRVAYDALLDAADLQDKHAGSATITSRQLRTCAKNLRGTIMDSFWTDDQGGYFVLGTDRDSAGRLRQLKIKTSNMGHLLHSRLLDGDDPMIVHRREAVIKQLFSAEMLGLNGIRTLASDEIRYGPGAYHNGSVWIWDNYVISQGLSQLGYHNLARCINNKLLNDIASTRRFPEYLRGDNDRQRRLNQCTVDVYDHRNNFLNHLEQPPQDIQAWSVAAILSLKLRRAGGQHQTVNHQKLVLERSLLGDDLLKV